MAQAEQVLIELEYLESCGTVVVNRSKGIRNCYRDKFSELLSGEAFSYPRFTSVKVDQKYIETFHSPHGHWVKRGDFHALDDEDVVHIDSLDLLAPVLKNFQDRGVTDVILQENCQGELFKFYGVRNRFFNLRYMGRTGKDRYTSVQGNSDIFFDHNRLEKLVHSAAEILDLDYFGGDCIITESGKMHFIDFNDWPSFRTCCQTAAPIMVSYAFEKLKMGGDIVNNFYERI
jgi:hypothetical protein